MLMTEMSEYLDTYADEQGWTPDSSRREALKGNLREITDRDTTLEAEDQVVGLAIIKSLADEGAERATAIDETAGWLSEKFDNETNQYEYVNTLSSLVRELAIA